VHKLYYSFWRIKVNLHDLPQSLAGALIGLVFAGIWVYLEPIVITPQNTHPLITMQFSTLLLSESGMSPSLSLRLFVALVAVVVIFSYRSIQVEKIGT
jgi:hypothetical protein